MSAKKNEIEKPSEPTQRLPTIDEQLRTLADGEQRAYALAQKYNDQQSWDMVEKIKRQKMALLQEKQRNDNMRMQMEVERRRQEADRQRDAERQQMFDQMNYNPINMNSDPYIAQMSHQQPMPVGVMTPTGIPQPTETVPNPQMFDPKNALNKPKKEGQFTFMDRAQTLIAIVTPIILIILILVVILFK